MELLGRCAELSSGDVNIVKPFELQRRMRMIIDNPIIATDVQVRSFLHPAFIFRNEVKVENGASCVIRDVGNVTNESDICFEYGYRGKGDFGTISSVPIQIQATFTHMDGTKSLRVFTERRKVVKDRKVAEKEIQVSILGLNSLQQAARMALQNDFDSAHKFLYSTGSLLRRNANTPEQQEELSIWVGFSEELDSVLRSQIDSKKKKMTDSSAKVLYNMKSINLVPFLSGEKKRIVVTKRKNHTKSMLASTH